MSVLYLPGKIRNRNRILQPIRQNRSYRTETVLKNWFQSRSSSSFSGSEDWTSKLYAQSRKAKEKALRRVVSSLPKQQSLQQHQVFSDIYLVFEGPVRRTRKQPKPDWTQLEKTGPSVVVHQNFSGNRLQLPRIEKFSEPQKTSQD